MVDLDGGSKQQNKYEVVRHLGAGGMAEVLLARQIGAAGFEKQVALKRLLAQSAKDQGYVRSLINEARLASQLSHPNIVQVFDFERIDGYYCLVMEYIDGMTLEEALNGCRLDGKRCPTELLAYIAMEAASGLAYLHGALGPDGVPLNLVHRDVKPSNIMLSRQGQVKLLDLGVAKSSSNLYRTTVGSGAKGTLAFMSPEQLSGEQVDATSDLFSLGVTVYEAVTLEPLFDDKNIVKLSQQMYQGLRPGRREAVNALFPGLVPVLERLLQPEPRLRYASAMELRTVLRPLARGMAAPELGEWLAQVRPVKTEAISQDATAMYDAESVTELKAVMLKHALSSVSNFQHPPPSPAPLSRALELPPQEEQGLVLSPRSSPPPQTTPEVSLSGEVTVQVGKKGQVARAPLSPVQSPARPEQPFKAASGNEIPRDQLSSASASPSTSAVKTGRDEALVTQGTEHRSQEATAGAAEVSTPAVQDSAPDRGDEATPSPVPVTPSRARATPTLQTGLPKNVVILAVTGLLALASLTALGIGIYQQRKSDPMLAALQEGASVAISSVPRGTVYIGGRDRGPQYTGVLKAGTHRVQIRAPSGEQKVFQINARRGEQLEYVWSFDEQRWLKGSD